MRQPLSPWIRFLQQSSSHTVAPPDWSKVGFNKKTIVAVRQYVEVCDSGIDLIVYLDPTFRPYYLQAALQYYDMVCAPYLQRLNESGIGNETEKTTLILAIWTLKKRLQDVQPKSGWWGRTIFDIVLAGIASRHQVGPGFEERVRNDEVVKQWLHDAQYYMPNVVVFDVCCFLLDTTVARWKQCKALEEWELSVRTERLLPCVRLDLQRAREALAEVAATVHTRTTTPPVWSNRALVDYALSTAKLSTSFREISQGHHWLSLWKDFRHIDQCSSCQVQFSASLLIANSPEPHRPLGDNWGRVERWCPAQCAEGALVSRIVERSLQSAVTALRVTLVPLALMFRVAASVLRHRFLHRQRLSWRELEEAVHAGKLPPSLLLLLRSAKGEEWEAACGHIRTW